MKHSVFNLDEECVMATGKNFRICGSAEKKKHDNEKGSSRASITGIRCGNAANQQGPTFLLLAGKRRNPDYSDDFLVKNGAAPGSTIIMTESAFLTNEAWVKMVPILARSLRDIVEVACRPLGISKQQAFQLKIILSFDGFKSHLEAASLIKFADFNIYCLVENRDSSAINQAFDKLVARSGKKRAARVLSLMTRSHITPIIDQWYLVLVVLAMLRDCAQSNVWQNSFIAVNMHPDYRLDFQEWIQKISPAVAAADKFEKETIDLAELLPRAWQDTPETQKSTWMKIIKDGDECFDVEMINELRQAGMGLSLLQHTYKIYHAEKAIRARCSSVQPQQMRDAVPSTTLTTKTKRPNKMIYHLFNPGQAATIWSPMERFEHAIKVRNRTMGPDKATKVSEYLDVHMTNDNKKFLSLTDDDLNMHRVLQESMCKHGFRRKVARRTLNALGGACGLSKELNDDEQVQKLKANLKFAESLEQVRFQERKRKRTALLKKKEKKIAASNARAERVKNKESKMKAMVLQTSKKVGISLTATFKPKHVSKLTSTMLSAIGFCYYNVTLSGKVGEKRQKLKELLGDEHEEESSVEEPAEEPAEEPEESDDSDKDEEDVIAFDKLNIGDLVEVYWHGEKKWFEGEITDCDRDSEESIEVHYKDDVKLWHSEKDYRNRLLT